MLQYDLQQIDIDMHDRPLVMTVSQYNAKGGWLHFGIFTF